MYVHLFQPMPQPPTQTPKDIIRSAWRPLRTTIIILLSYLVISLPLYLILERTANAENEGWGLALFYLLFVPVTPVLLLLLFVLIILSVYRAIKTFQTAPGFQKQLKNIIIINVLLGLGLLLSLGLFLVSG